MVLTLAVWLVASITSDTYRRTGWAGIARATIGAALFLTAAWLLGLFTLWVVAL